MFRKISSGIASRKPMNNLCIQFIRNEFTASRPQFNPEPEKFNATLCGTIDWMPFTRSLGDVSVNLKTHNTYDGSFAIHFVVLRSKSMRRIISSNRLAEGVRLYVNGLIMYRDFIGADDKIRRRAHILALDAYICDKLPDSNDTSFDVNDVKMFGHVSKTAYHLEQETFLEVSTTYFDRKLQTYESKIHTLIIFDSKLRELAGSFEVGTQVIVNGQIDTQLVERKDGLRVTSALIRPYSMFASSWKS